MNKAWRYANGEEVDEPQLMSMVFERTEKERILREKEPENLAPLAC